MSEIRVLTVELPASLVRMIEKKIQTGEYASESDVVRESLEALQELAAPTDGWLRRQALPVYEACLEDPSRLRSADEVFATLEERYREDMRTLGREP